MKLKKTLALLLSLVMLLGCMPAMAINVSGENIAVDGTATSMVMVDAEPVQMTVTVPSVLPATVDAKGTVTVATDAKVINKSYGPVAVTAIKAEPVSPWALVGSGYNFAAAKVNSKLVQISIEGNVVGTDGNVSMNSNWVIAGNGGNYPFSYGVRIPAQRTALVDTSLSNVVFTVDWYEGGGNTASSTEYSLSLDKDYLAMYPGTAEQVHATTTSETMVASLAAEEADEVAWSTSNANVAQVVDGHVEAKSIGTAVIKAEYHGLTATCVAAVAEVPVPLQAIGFSKNKLTLYKGESETVLLAYNPDKFTGSADVSITAGSDAVTALPTSLTGVTADQGATPVTITANKAGETTITATATIDGRTITAKMTVEVIAKLESLVIDGPDSVIEGETITLTATKTPADATGEIVWSTSDTSVATAYQNGVVTGVAEGEVIITAECGGIRASWKVIVKPGVQEASIDWEYAVDDKTSAITLTKYIGQGTDVTVRNKYIANGKVYQNVQMGESVSNRGPFAGSAKKTQLTSVTFEEGVTLPANASYMFYNCSSLTNIDIKMLNTGNVMDMSYMFRGCSKLTNLDLSGFNIGNVTDMRYMFQGCSGLTSLDLSNFNTNSVADMRYMFYGCSNLKSLDLSNFNASSVTNMSNMFFGCFSLTSIYAGDAFTTDKVINSTDMFYNCSNLIGGNGTKYDSSHIDKTYARIDKPGQPGYFTGPVLLADYAVLYSDGTLAFQNGNQAQGNHGTIVNSWAGEGGWATETYARNNKAPWYNNRTRIAKVEFVNKAVPKNTAYWFYICLNLASIDMAMLDTSSVMDMSHMFDSCSKLTNLDVSKFDTSSVTNMEGMFWNCSKLTNLDVSNFDTSSVTNMGNMFNGCSKLTSLNVSNFNTSSVTYMYSMFSECSKLTSLDVSNFNTSNVTDIDSMFYGCSSLINLDVTGFNTSKVTKMGSMFASCFGLTNLDVSNFNTSSVTNMWRMFYGSSGLTTIYAGDTFITDKVTNGNDMFGNCSQLVGGNGTKYDSSHIDKTYACIDKSGQPGYFTAKP